MNLLYEHLNNPVIEWMCRVIRRTACGKGRDPDCRGGEEQRNLLPSGRVFDLIMWGDRKIGVVGPGDIIGETVLVDVRPSSVSVVASEPSLVLAMPVERLRCAMGDGQIAAAEVYRAIAAILAEKLRLVSASCVRYGDRPGRIVPRPSRSRPYERGHRPDSGRPCWISTKKR